MGSVMDQTRPWEPGYNDPPKKSPMSDVLKKTDDQLRLEQDIAALIGTETTMPDHRTMPAPEAPREAPDIEHVRMNEFIENSRKELNNALDQAYTEQSWWAERVRSLERVRDGVDALDARINAPIPETASGTKGRGEPSNSRY